MLIISYKDQNCNASIELATEDYLLFNDIQKLLMNKIQTEQSIQKHSSDLKMDSDVLNSLIPPIPIHDVSLGC